MLSFDQIKKEFNKLFQKDYLQAEVNRLKKELSELDAFKKIQEPTQKHLNQLEKQYAVICKKILIKQKELDKEFNSAVGMIKKRRVEAESHIRDLQKLAQNQKKSVEKLVRKQMKAFGLAGAAAKKKKKKKKAKTSPAQKKKSTSKVTKKSSKKTTSKSTKKVAKNPVKKTKKKTK